MNEYTKVADLNHEIEAQIMEDILNDRQIPHILKSLHSGAYGDLFQLQRGWGAISAPEQYHSTIHEILADLRNM